MSVARVSSRDDEWLHLVLEALRDQGCAVVTDVLTGQMLERVRTACYGVQKQIHRDVGVERLERAGELGVLRIPFLYDPLFFEFLSLPQVLSVVDATVGETAILHVLNGFILPSLAADRTPAVFQNTFHRDFPRVLNGYLMSVNTFFAIDAFTEENGATIVAPGTHQQDALPDSRYLDRIGVPVIAPAGSMLVFDSTLWHAAGRNRSRHDRLAVNMQFTRSYLKQQIDYVRALGDDGVLSLPPRTQQLLGWYTRVVTNLDEYYRPEQERLYRRGQG